MPFSRRSGERPSTPAMPPVSLFARLRAIASSTVGGPLRTTQPPTYVLREDVNGEAHLEPVGGFERDQSASCGDRQGLPAAPCRLPPVALRSLANEQTAPKDSLARSLHGRADDAVRHAHSPPVSTSDRGPISNQRVQDEETRNKSFEERKVEVLVMGTKGAESQLAKNTVSRLEYKRELSRIERMSFEASVERQDEIDAMREQLARLELYRRASSTSAATEPDVTCPAGNTHATQQSSPLRRRSSVGSSSSSQSRKTSIASNLPAPHEEDIQPAELHPHTRPRRCISVADGSSGSQSRKTSGTSDNSPPPGDSTNCPPEVAADDAVTQLLLPAGQRRRSCSVGSSESQSRKTSAASGDVSAAPDSNGCPSLPRPRRRISVESSPGSQSRKTSTASVPLTPDSLGGTSSFFHSPRPRRRSSVESSGSQSRKTSTASMPPTPDSMGCPSFFHPQAGAASARKHSAGSPIDEQSGSGYS
eukprot:Opistho-1_new@60280